VVALTTNELGVPGWTVDCSMARLTGRATSRTVSVPASVQRPSEQSSRAELNVIEGYRAASRNRAERTSPSRCRLPVWKLVVSISTWTLESVIGSARSTRPWLMVIVPRTGASPKR
jgi:hypothetical protein